MARHRPEWLESGNHRRASSDATATSPAATAAIHHSLQHFLAPSVVAAATKEKEKEKDGGRDSSSSSPFDFKRLFGDRHSLDRERDRDRDRDRLGGQSLSASNPNSRACTPSPVPPPTPPQGAPLPLPGGDMASPPPAAKIHASPSKVNDAYFRTRVRRVIDCCPSVSMLAPRLNH